MTIKSTNLLMCLQNFFSVVYIFVYRKNSQKYETCFTITSTHPGQIFENIGDIGFVHLLPDVLMCQCSECDSYMHIGCRKWLAQPSGI